MLLHIPLPPGGCCVIVLSAAAQIRHGVLGFEMEQLLPTEIGASLADLQQQQQQDFDDLSDCDCGSAASGSDLGSQLRGSASGQLVERMSYKEAAGKIREAMAAGRHELRSKVSAMPGGGGGTREVTGG
jgi:hypothetical protein